MSLITATHVSPNGKLVVRTLALALGIIWYVPALAQPADEPALAEEAPVDETAPPVAEPAEDEPTLSDLDRAYAAYSLCVDEAAATLAEAGEAAEVIGVRALAACGEERAAYVNAFYFALLPQAGETDEPLLRARAERLVAQTDSFLIAKINEGSSPAPDADAEAAPAAEDEAASE